ncbi:MAG: hypothetical protein PHN22_00320 [Candidatus ainarchaeum sp.]|nr:hypothetical protein [Candidatus ainarchaeum sp.]
MDILENIDYLINNSREVYRSIIVPLYQLKKEELILTLKKLETSLEKLAQDTISINRKTLIQYSIEINTSKMQLFHEDFLILANNIKKQIFLEENKAEVKNQLLNIKEAISHPQTYYDIEEKLKNEINIYIDFLESAKLQIKNKYIDISKEKKTKEELLKIIEAKNHVIKEQHKKINDYSWLEAKEKAKDSKISGLEEALLKKVKVTEERQILLKIHVSKIESEINEIYRHIKNLNHDIKSLDNFNLEKEQISLELIRELKDELLATRYALSKKLNKE